MSVRATSSWTPCSGEHGIPARRVALSVGGTVRSPLHTGVVTMGDLLATMPFDNTLVVGDLTGKQLLGALEHGASGYENGAGRFLQVAGLTYSVEPAKPVGQRVSAVSVRTRRAVGNLCARKRYTASPRWTMRRRAVTVSPPSRK